MVKAQYGRAVEAQSQRLASDHDVNLLGVKLLRFTNTPLQEITRDQFDAFVKSLPEAERDLTRGSVLYGLKLFWHQVRLANVDPNSNFREWSDEKLHATTCDLRALAEDERLASIG